MASIQRFQRIIDKYCLTSGALLAYRIRMQTDATITRAYHRLLEHFGTEEEKTLLDGGKPPLGLPSEAELMQRAEREAHDPAAGTAYLRAALELAGRDQRHAETREINIVARLRERGVPWREI